MRHARLTWRLLLLTCIASTRAASQAASASARDAAPAGYVATPYAWDVSIALEAASDIRGAQTVMQQRYGLRPATYAPCVRLAWLSLALGEYDEAIALYRRANALDGAQTEASQGLAIALARKGYLLLDRGDFSAARRTWDDARALDSTNRDATHGLSLIGNSNELAPEVWAARIGAASGTSSANVIYVGMPVRINSAYSLRVAVRSVMSPSTSVVGGTPFFGAQKEFFLGGGMETDVIGVDAVVMQLSNDFRSGSGGALGVRIGGTTSATITASAVQTASGSNIQVAPAFSRWISPNVRVGVGARFTSDSSLTGASGNAGITVRGARAMLDMSAHAGTERWAFDMAGPTMLSFNAQTSGGATATASFALTPSLTFSVQAQGERLAPAAANNGWYTSFAAGLRLTKADTQFGAARRTGS